MSAPGPVRSAATEVNWECDPAAVAWAGSRPVQHFWPMLAPYFRDVLLAPRRRAEDRTVTWQWDEPAPAPVASAGDLRALRRRLADAQERLAENLGRPEHAPGGKLPDRRQADLDRLVPVMARVTGEMSAWDDARLSAHACRADGGWRLHTWGTAAAPTVRYPAETTSAAVPEKPPRRRRFGFGWAVAATVAALLAVAFLWIRKPEPAERNVAVAEPKARESSEPTAEIPLGAAAEQVQLTRAQGTAARGGDGLAEHRGERGMSASGAITTVGSSTAGQPSVMETVERVVPMPVSALASGLTPGQAGAGPAPPLTGAPVGLPESVENSSRQAKAGSDFRAGSDSKASATADRRPDGARAETWALVAAVADVAPPADEEEPPQNEERSPRTEPVDSQVVNPTGEGARVAPQVSPRVPDAFTQTLRVPWRAWRLQLVGDAIVPTQPLPVGRVADTSARRELLRAERQARIPPAMAAAAIRCGVDFERVDPGAARPERWTWSADARAEPTADPAAPAVAPSMPEAQVRFDVPTQSLVIRVGEGVRATLWFEVADMPRAWRWQSASGVPLAAEGAARVALPLRAGDEAASAQRGLTLVDPESGWGLVGGR